MQSIFEKVKRWLLNPQMSLSAKSTVQPAHPKESAEDIRRGQHGSVTILNNEIFVDDPDDEGSFATITIPQDPRLTVAIDGEPCVGRMIVHKDQDIQIILRHTPPSRRFLTKVSKDAMEVTGRVEVTLGEEYRLKDNDHARHAILEIEAQQVPPGSLGMEDITDQLQRAGYQGELDNEALEVLSHATETTEMIVLRGQPVNPGRPARYKLVELPKVYDPLHRRMMITTISMGTTVAIGEDERSGIPGKDVFGHEVPVPAHRPLPALGGGVVDVNGRLVAVRAGRLVYTRRRIDVVPELVIGHDLSSRDGKVEFDGDIIILGSVLDGCFVKATGSVKVHGAVLGSTVMGEQGVLVANAIVGSKIIAGQSKILYTQLHSVVKQCLTELGQFRAEYMELVKHVKQRNDEQLRLPMVADVLLTKRHPGLERSFAYLSDDTENLTERDDRYKKIVLELRSKWRGAGRTNIDERDVSLLHQWLEDYTAYVESMMSVEQAEIRGGSVASSSVRSSGNIVVTGTGAHASSFEAGDSIVVRGSTRGGFLVAENSVRLYELGTSSGVESSIKVVNTSGKITVRIRHPNTLLQVAARRNRNLVPEYYTVFKGSSDALAQHSRQRLA
ncbi:MAG: FapA family protein [Bacilli bacterium]